MKIQLNKLYIDYEGDIVRVDKLYQEDGSGTVTVVKKLSASLMGGYIREGDTIAVGSFYFNNLIPAIKYQAELEINKLLGGE
jgi:hypothetical protein